MVLVSLDRAPLDPSPSLCCMAQMSVRLDRACCAVLLGRAPSQPLQLLGMPEVLQAAAARAAAIGLTWCGALGSFVQELGQQNQRSPIDIFVFSAAILCGGGPGLQLWLLQAT
eukprot:861121-Pelagomonas_calceolata.AAC.6